MKLKSTLPIFFFLFLTVSAIGQPGSLDTTFAIGTGFNNHVIVSAIQNDGKILVGGNFTSYNGIPANRIARLNPDGTLDTTFTTGTGFDNVVYSFAIQPDNKIIMGGWFTSYNGNSTNYIVRLNEDGSVDSSFNPTGTGFNWRVEKTILQSDGKIIVGGLFVSFNGATKNYIARLNHDGSLDNSFNTGTGFSNWTKSISIQQDNKIIVGGNFQSFNGTTTNYLTRLNTDGSFDPTFDAGPGLNDIVMTTTVQPDGKIIAGGDFTSFNGTAVNRIVRLNTDGSLDMSFNTGTGFDNRLRTLSLQQNGRIIIGGAFNEFNGTTVNLITRLNPNGTMDTTFQTGTGFTNTGALITLLSSDIQQDGQIIVGGTFVEYNGQVLNKIARLNGDCIMTGNTDTIVACNSHTWIDGNTYFANNNTATYTLTNSQGCDSILALHLTIEQIDISVTQNENLLTANQNGADYQWLDCNNMQEISGATEQSFTALINGNYAVAITLNNCNDTSACYSINTIDIEEILIRKDWIIFPNPSNGQFNIETEQDGVFEMLDFTGKLIEIFSITSGNIQINTDLRQNVYFIRERLNGRVQKLIIL
jgi:uncharacterized delta-60 repeat protein